MKTSRKHFDPAVGP